uniref:Uncharacterized protein n=1 Tax=Siphoviridae sp. ctbbV81 TaxID=2827900 RepID=A0A8S5TQR7_9CAUD|nr:MAG TPA: hypothetical protein [Siphoviridae sp. ctbbV81]DAH50182.1 MAG TPA: hypothetical protein [Caudoviricetes sp.]
MLIRSQDKSRLINLNNTRELRFWECAQGFDITDCVCPIGHYSTKAKATKALDMIQEAYCKFMSVKNDDAWGGKESVFCMPEDSEVEV